VAAAELLRRGGHGDIAEMGALLARAVPPVVPAVMLAAGPELTGRVVTYRWPVGGPPEDWLGPSGRRVQADAETVRPSACLRCGKPLHRWFAGLGGRPGTAAARAGRLRIVHGTERHLEATAR